MVCCPKARKKQKKGTKTILEKTNIAKKRVAAPNNWKWSCFGVWVFACAFAGGHLSPNLFDIETITARRMNENEILKIVGALQQYDPANERKQRVESKKDTFMSGVRPATKKPGQKDCPKG